MAAFSTAAESRIETTDTSGYLTKLAAFNVDGKWEASLALLDDMDQKGKSLNVDAYKLAIGTCLKGKQYDVVLGLFDNMRDDALPPSTDVLDNVLESMMESEEFTRTAHVISSMDSEKLQWTAEMFRKSLRGCREATDATATVSLFRMALADDLSVSITQFVSAVQICGDSGDLNALIDIIEFVPEAGISFETTKELCDAVVTAFVQNGSIMHAMKVYRHSIKNFQLSHHVIVSLFEAVHSIHRSTVVGSMYELESKRGCMFTPMHTLMAAYAFYRCGDEGYALQMVHAIEDDMLDKMPHLDLRNAMIFFHSIRCSEIYLKLFEHLMHRDVSYSPFVIANALRYYGTSGDFAKAFEFYSLLLEEHPDHCQLSVHSAMLSTCVSNTNVSKEEIDTMWGHIANDSYEAEISASQHGALVGALAASGHGDRIDALMAEVPNLLDNQKVIQGLLEGYSKADNVEAFEAIAEYALRFEAGPLGYITISLMLEMALKHRNTALTDAVVEYVAKWGPDMKKKNELFGQLAVLCCEAQSAKGRMLLNTFITQLTPDFEGSEFYGVKVMAALAKSGNLPVAKELFNAHQVKFPSYLWESYRMYTTLMQAYFNVGKYGSVAKMFYDPPNSSKRNSLFYSTFIQGSLIMGYHKAASGASSAWERDEGVPLDGEGLGLIMCAYANYDRTERAKGLWEKERLRIDRPSDLAFITALQVYDTLHLVDDIIRTNEEFEYVARKEGVPLEFKRTFAKIMHKYPNQDVVPAPIEQVVLEEIMETPPPIVTASPKKVKTSAVKPLPAFVVQPTMEVFKSTPPPLVHDTAFSTELDELIQDDQFEVAMYHVETRFSSGIPVAPKALSSICQGLLHLDQVARMVDFMELALSHKTSLNFGSLSTILRECVHREDFRNAFRIIRSYTAAGLPVHGHETTKIILKIFAKCGQYDLIAEAFCGNFYHPAKMYQIAMVHCMAGKAWREVIDISRKLLERTESLTVPQYVNVLTACEESYDTPAAQIFLQELRGSCRQTEFLNAVAETPTVSTIHLLYFLLPHKNTFAPEEWKMCLETLRGGMSETDLQSVSAEWQTLTTTH